MIFVPMGACELSKDVKPPQTGNQPDSSVVGEAVDEKGKTVFKDTLQKIKNSSTLRVAMQGGYPPFQFRGPSGQLEGMDVDLANMVAKELAVQVRIEERPWNELIDALLADEADVIMSAMTITARRNMRALFTDPVLVTGRMFLVKRENLQKIRRVSDLNKPGNFLCSLPEGLGPLDFGRIFPEASHREFQTRERAIQEVMEGRCMAYIDEEFTIRMLCAKRSHELASSFQRLTHEPIAFAIRPGDNHWLNWLNNFIGKIKYDGSLDDLRKKWLQDYYLDLNR